MIELTDVRKTYPTSGGVADVLRGINLAFGRGDKIGIIGRNGAGKSTLIRLIGGIETPTGGTIRRSMSISWPLGFQGGFQASLTGIDNVRFIARIYDCDENACLDYVQEFSELGKYLREPIKIYSSGMRARLAFGISMAVDFDCYLIDEVFAVGDMRFQQKCRDELFEKRSDKAMVIISHDLQYVKDHCAVCHVLDAGILRSFDNFDGTANFHNETMR